MSRAARLLDLVQLLRRHRHPVSGAPIAEELGISLRTLYRHIVTLQAQGAAIDGAPGLGYLLRQGFMLPPALQAEMQASTLLVARLPPAGDAAAADPTPTARQAIRQQHKLSLAYRDGRPAGSNGALQWPAGGPRWMRCMPNGRPKGIRVLQPPTAMDFGCTFTACDAAGHRLRVHAPGA